jgi:FkbM family methyltransferase
MHGERLMDICFNIKAAFTRWAVRSGVLQEPFVVVDVGVQGGESVRWHLLGDHLVVHGFDALAEVVEGLKRQNARLPNRHYHWIAAGNVDEERAFYFNAEDPFSSSMYRQGQDRFRLDGGRRDRERTVTVRRLDTLLAAGVIPKADFLKIDVEGYEKDVLLGARALLDAGVLGVEIESNFGVSPTYPQSHFGAVTELLLQHHLLVFDINFNRIARASFQRALLQRQLPAIADQHSVGKPATLNVLLCRDLIDEADRPQNYTTPVRPVNVDQLLKSMIICELHGLNDIALDTAERFAQTLSSRLDVEQAISLLADPACRNPGAAPTGDVPAPAAPIRPRWPSVAGRRALARLRSGWR